MSPAELLLQTRALASARPFDLSRLAELFAAADGLLELELAGAWAVRLMPHEPVFAWLDHPDEQERLRAVQFIGRLGSSGARFLRHAVLDPRLHVARTARRLIWQLELRDVALPNARPRRPAFQATAFEVGRWNPTGWAEALFHRQPLETRADWAGPARFPTGLLAELGVDAADLPSFWRSFPGRRAWTEFEVPKRGGLRTIAAPKPRLKQLQRRLLDDWLSKVPLHEAAHGFRAGRSIVTHARKHVGAALVVSLDLQDFFPSIHRHRVLGLLSRLAVPTRQVDALSQLLTWRRVLPDGRLSLPGVLPQGAPTSPVIANLLSRRMDARLTGLAQRFGATYSRYADDLTFSFREPRPARLARFLWWVNAICQQEGFVENAPKRRFMRSGGRMEVTGLAVNQRVSVPRHVRRRFKAVLHNVSRDGLKKQARGRPVKAFANWLHGMAAYISMVHPELQGWVDEVRRLLEKEGLR